MEKADGVYPRILTDINGPYVIGYYSANKTRDGEQRKNKIEVADILSMWGGTEHLPWRRSSET